MSVSVSMPEGFSSKEPPWLRNSRKPDKNLDPNGSILRETIEEMDAVREKYIQLQIEIQNGNPQGIYFNTIDIKEAIKNDQKYKPNITDHNSTHHGTDTFKQNHISDNESPTYTYQNGCTKKKKKQYPYYGTEEGDCSSNNECLHGSLWLPKSHIKPPNRYNKRPNDLFIPPSSYLQQDSGWPPLPSSKFLSRRGDGIQVIPGRVDNPLEVEAIMQYNPGLDSKHDMIFGNIMGVNYGDYAHGVLWPTAPNNFSQPHNNNLGLCLQNMSNSNIHNIVSQNAITGPSFTGGSNPQIQPIYQGAGGPSECKVIHYYQQKPQCHPHRLLWQDAQYVEAPNNYNLQHAPQLTPYCGRHNAFGSQLQGLPFDRRVNKVGSPRKIWADVGRNTLKQAALRCGAIQDHSSHLGSGRINSRGAVSCSSEPVIEVLHLRPMGPTGSTDALLEETKRQMIEVRRRGKTFDLNDCSQHSRCIKATRVYSPGHDRITLSGPRSTRTSSLSDIRFLSNNTFSSSHD